MKIKKQALEASLAAGFAFKPYKDYAPALCPQCCSFVDRYSVDTLQRALERLKRAAPERFRALETFDPASEMTWGDIQTGKLLAGLVAGEEL